MSKLTELTEITTPVQSGDTLYTVRPADGTAGSYKTTVADLGLPVKLQTITGPVLEFDFTLPTGFNRFILKGYVGTDEVTDVGNLNAYFNDDLVDSNYYYQYFRVTGTSPTGAEGPLPQCLTVDTAEAGSSTYSAVELVIEGPSVAYRKRIRSTSEVMFNNDQYRQYTYTMMHDSMTSTLTRLRLRPATYGTINVTGSLTLYGQA